MARCGPIHYKSAAVHLFLAGDDSKDALQRELSELAPDTMSEPLPGLFACDLAGEVAGALPLLAFARQVVPDARPARAPSIRGWATLLVEAVAGVLPDHRPWSLHVYPFKQVVGSKRMGARAWHSRTHAEEPVRPRPAERSASAVGDHRCRLIRDAAIELLQKRRRHLVRYLREHDGVFAEDESLVQLVLTAPEEGFLSVLPAPRPSQQRHVISSFPGGQLELASDKQAPSRAFAKLVEAEVRMGRRIGARETCVDLGASPGSWTYVAARRGAKVTAVDRSELRADLMQHPQVIFHRGDAFRFEPQRPVDWLLCDVIASAERSAELLVNWLRRGWCRQFVVTLKLDDSGSIDVLSQLKWELPELTDELWLLRLCANKKEVCAFGAVP